MRKPFFKKSHSAWYVHHQGSMIRVGEEREAALQPYHEMMAANAPTAYSDSVASLLNNYLDWCQKNRSTRTYEWCKYMLSSFAKSIGVRLRIRSLKPLYVTQWMDAQSWNDTTKYNAVRSIKRVFNWAVKQGRLPSNPLQSLERQAPLRREAYVTRDQFQTLLDQVSDQCFQDYLLFLFETGARPQEIRVIEAKHCDLASNRIVLPTSQAKGKRAPRVIFCTEVIRPMIKRLCQENPTGALFRNSDGNPWSKNAVNCRMRRLRKNCGELGTSMEGLCATALRHGFATEALKNGVDPVTVSILMGHRDTTMVARTYQHLAADAEFLAGALERAKGRRA